MSSPFQPPVTPTTQRTIDTPVGLITLMGDAHHLTHLLYDHQVERVRRRHDPVVDDHAFADVVAQLSEYFAGDRTEFDVPLAPEGTPFQLRVWEELTRIAYGETWSYGELAARIDRPGAARAVGAANGRNPISIIVPCHRVIGASGRLTGYGGGLDAKSTLLDLERDHSAPRLLLGV